MSVALPGRDPFDEVWECYNCQQVNNAVYSPDNCSSCDSYRDGSPSYEQSTSRSAQIRQNKPVSTPTLQDEPVTIERDPKQKHPIRKRAVVFQRKPPKPEVQTHVCTNSDCDICCRIRDTPEEKRSIQDAQQKKAAPIITQPKPPQSQTQAKEGRTALRASGYRTGSVFVEPAKSKRRSTSRPPAPSSSSYPRPRRQIFGQYETSNRYPSNSRDNINKPAPSNDRDMRSSYLRERRTDRSRTAEYYDPRAKPPRRVLHYPSEPSESDSDANSDSSYDEKQSRSTRTTMTSNSSNEIRLHVDASAPISLSFNGDMEGRNIRLLPNENGMADLIIGNARGGEGTYDRYVRPNLVKERRPSRLPITDPSSPGPDDFISCRRTVTSAKLTDREEDAASKSKSAQQVPTSRRDSVSRRSSIIPPYNSDATSTRSPAWSAQNDDTLIQARAQGLSWSQIVAAHFPHKTPNACSKRHVQLENRPRSRLESPLSLQNKRVSRELNEYPAKNPFALPPVPSRAANTYPVENTRAIRTNRGAFVGQGKYGQEGNVFDLSSEDEDGIKTYNLRAPRTARSTQYRARPSLSAYKHQPSTQSIYPYANPATKTTPQSDPHEASNADGLDYSYLSDSYIAAEPPSSPRIRFNQTKTVSQDRPDTAGASDPSISNRQSLAQEERVKQVRFQTERPEVRAKEMMHVEQAEKKLLPLEANRRQSLKEVHEFRQKEEEEEEEARANERMDVEQAAKKLRLLEASPQKRMHVELAERMRLLQEADDRGPALGEIEKPLREVEKLRKDLETEESGRRHDAKEDIASPLKQSTGLPTGVGTKTMSRSPFRGARDLKDHLPSTEQRPRRLASFRQNSYSGAPKLGENTGRRQKDVTSSRNKVRSWFSSAAIYMGIPMHEKLDYSEYKAMQFPEIPGEAYRNPALDTTRAHHSLLREENSRAGSEHSRSISESNGRKVPEVLGEEHRNPRLETIDLHYSRLHEENSRTGNINSPSISESRKEDSVNFVSKQTLRKTPGVQTVDKVTSEPDQELPTGLTQISLLTSAPLSDQERALAHRSHGSPNTSLQPDVSIIPLGSDGSDAVRVDQDELNESKRLQKSYSPGDILPPKLEAIDESFKQSMLKDEINMSGQYRCEDIDCDKVYLKLDARLEHYRKVHPHLALGFSTRLRRLSSSMSLGLASHQDMSPVDNGELPSGHSGTSLAGDLSEAAEMTSKDDSDTQKQTTTKPVRKFELSQATPPIAEAEPEDYNWDTLGSRQLEESRSLLQSSDQETEGIPAQVDREDSHQGRRRNIAAITAATAAIGSVSDYPERRKQKSGIDSNVSEDDSHISVQDVDSMIVGKESEYRNQRSPHLKSSSGNELSAVPNDHATHASISHDDNQLMDDVVCLDTFDREVMFRQFSVDNTSWNEDDNVSVISSHATSVASIFSVDSLASSASVLSKSSGYSAVQILTATKEVLAILYEDLVLQPLFASAIENPKIGPERLQRNFRRLLKLYAEQLESEAKDRLEYLASRLVALKAAFLAQSIVEKFHNTPRSPTDRSESSDEDEDDQNKARPVDEDSFEDLTVLREFLISGDAFKTLKSQVHWFVSSQVPLNIPDKDSMALGESEPLKGYDSGRYRAGITRTRTWARWLDDAKLTVDGLLPMSDVYLVRQTSLHLALDAFYLATDNVLINTGLLEPALDEGKVRLRWQCKCGDSLHSDVVELRENGVSELVSHMQRTSETNVYSTPYSHNSSTQRYIKPRPSQWFLNAVTKISSTFGTASTTPSCLPQHNNSCAAIACAPTSGGNPAQQDILHLLTCMHRSGVRKVLKQDRMEGVTTDRTLLCFLRKQYLRHRGRLLHKLSLKSVKGIFFVKFRLPIGGSVDVRHHNPCCVANPTAQSPCECIPPLPKVEPSPGAEYRCIPGPPATYPPIPPEYLSSLFTCPSDAHKDDTWILDQLPKRTCGELQGKVGQPAEGWGIYYQEGLDRDMITLLVFIVFLLASLLFGVLWSKFQFDMQAAFGVSAWMVAASSIITTMIATRAEKMG